MRKKGKKWRMSAEIEEKDFLQEDDDAGSSLFWSVEPVEWSPLAFNEEGSEVGR